MQYGPFVYRDLAQPKIVEAGPRNVYIESRLSLHGLPKPNYVKRVQCRAFFKDGYFQSADAGIFYDGHPVVYDKSLKLVDAPFNFPPMVDDE